MTTEEALRNLAQSTAEAVEGVLLQYLSRDALERGSPLVVPEGAGAFDLVELPGVATNVAYVDASRGGNVFAITTLGARRLAALMMGREPPEGGDEEPSELDLSAVGEVANKAMAAAASATSSVLGIEVEISPPETRLLPDRAAAEEAFELSSHAISTPFVIAGQPARLVQLVPNAFVVRLTRALDESDAKVVDGQAVVDRQHAIQAEALKSVPVQLWAELGRFRMEVGRAVQLAPGGVVELDTAVDDPIDVFVNGRRLGTARLLVGAEGEWAIRLEALIRPELELVPTENSGSGGSPVKAIGDRENGLAAGQVAELRDQNSG